MTTLTAATGFPAWIKHVPDSGERRRCGATVIFPHAGGTAASYRGLAAALAAGGDAFIVQYPQRAERFADPAAATLPELARDLFDAGDWDAVGPLRLFGHSMGSLVAFEFARTAERRGAAVRKLWVSAGPAPGTVAGLPTLPTDDAGLRADMADLGGTDPRLLADEEFAELLTVAVRGDYHALNRYRCGPDVAIRADIHAVGGRTDHRVDAESLRRWARHTTGAFGLSFYDGGHFYLNEHIEAVAAQVNADVR
ncbi:thioesterase II family protein [Mycobacterium sp. pUA109]|uniref:thioesterase II family protein n=1 Tax=Mycobacterium sp. pUA109 TaxID=3238982 RepID=UPI00351B915E